MGSAPPPSSAAARRAQLADFLRTRRAAVPPTADARNPDAARGPGAPARARRRTPGLRREEVAQRAGVGVSWYTWLEQGRDINPSPQVLRAIAGALELSPAQLDHLFLLAGATAPATAAPADCVPDEDTLALVHALTPHIAYVLSPRFDVVAHNRPAELIMSDLVTAPPDRRNLLRWLFDPAANWDTASPEWTRTARANLLDFRAEYARHPADPAYTELVDTLLATSETLRRWWSEHDVHPLEPARKHIPHPTHGPLDLLQTQTRPAHQPALRLRILVPANPTTRAVLAALTAR